MTICVFTGPTVPAAMVRDHLPEAVLLPPVAQGDVLRAMAAHDPQAIAIIDGFFEQRPAVWHKEILWALSHGISVFGASSMGALRAAELEGFGMVGVGRIFQAYKSGVFPPFEPPFEDEDEVAVSHGPAELGYPGSVALVDMRASLAAAREAAIIDTDRCARLATIGKSIFYKDRTYGELLSRAAVEMENEEVRKLTDWLESHPVEQKRLDAEALFAILADIENFSFTPQFHFEHTNVWQAALQTVQKEIS